MSAQKYRKKPVVIEAVQLTWGTWGEMCDFVGSIQVEDCCKARMGKDNKIELMIPTLEGDMLAKQGDWIIRGVQGEFYPCKPDVFELTYEPVDHD